MTQAITSVRSTRRRPVWQIPIERLERLLALVQTFDPSGVGARDLAECLAIQLRERDRFDPAMKALVANLPLLAKRDISALRKICNVDEEDIADMLAEIRQLDPKPGRAFGGGRSSLSCPTSSSAPRPAAPGMIELNTGGAAAHSRQQRYAARVTKNNASDVDRTFMSTCLQTANWLTKSLEQRARTILKVSSEIVRQQDAFFQPWRRTFAPAQPQDHRRGDRHA